MDNIPELRVNAKDLPEQKNEYVCWLDIMGTRAIMTRSLQSSMIYILKLHTAFLKAFEDNGGSTNDIKYYPMGDGLYISAEEQDDLFPILSDTFAILAQDVINQGEQKYRYVVKASVAYGPIVHGRNLKNVNNVLDDKDEYKEQLLFGIPIVQAFSGEKKTPPFGVYIHESARAFAPKKGEEFKYSWWNWYNASGNNYTGTAKNLQSILHDYYDWCEKNHARIEYPEDKIEEHRKLMGQYLPA